MLQPEFLQKSPNQDEMWSRQYLSEKKNIVIIHPNPIYEKRKKRKRGRKRIREIFARITINTYEWHIEREKNAGKSLKRGWQWPCDRRLAVKKHTARGFRSLLAWFFPILIPGAIIFFFSSPVFSNHYHHRQPPSPEALVVGETFFSVDMDARRRVEWGAGFVGWKLFNDRAKRQLELDGRGTHNQPLQLFTPNFSDLSANLDI